jgi:hypothetical protein
MKGDAAQAAAGIARERGAFAAPFEGRKRKSRAALKTKLKWVG